MVVVAVSAYAMAARGLFLGRMDGLVLLAIYAIAMVLLIGNAAEDGGVLDGSAPQGPLHQFDGMGDLYSSSG